MDYHYNNHFKELQKDPLTGLSDYFKHYFYRYNFLKGYST